jgi:hypothetical protein
MVKLTFPIAATVAIIASLASTASSAVTRCKDQTILNLQIILLLDDTV